MRLQSLVQARLTRRAAVCMRNFTPCHKAQYTSAGASCSRERAPAPPLSCSIHAELHAQAPRAGPSSSLTPPSSPSTTFRTMSRSQSRATGSPRLAPTDEILKKYPNADVYDGRGKAIFPGLINCHAHLAATLERGFNEDFGFPNSARLAVRPGEPAARRRGHADGDGRRAGSAQDRDHDAGRKHGRHCALGRRAGQDGPAHGVRRVGSRQRERAGSAVAGRTRQERNATVLGEAARRGHAAHQRSVQQVARHEQRPRQGVPRRRARRDRRHPS